MAYTSFISILLNLLTTSAVLSAGVMTLPSEYYKDLSVTAINKFDWEGYGTTPYYTLETVDIEILSQAEILHKFASNMLENTKDLDSSIAEAINDNFSKLF